MIYSREYLKLKLFFENICELFKEQFTTTTINNYILENSKINNKINNSKINNSKINCNALMYYIFYSFFKNESKTSSSDKLKNIYKNICRESYSKKSKKIPISFFTNLRKKVFDIYSKHYCKKGTVTNKIIMAGDGTNTLDSNFNVSLNMGLYDVTNGVPLELQYEGNKNRNCESKLTKEYITKNINKFKNVIIVLDAFYYDINLFNFLIDNNIYFIIRGRTNCKNYNKNLPLGKMGKQEQIMYTKVRNIIRLITYENEIEKNINSKRKKQKTDINYDIVIDKTVNLITNLPKKYTDTKIKEIYGNRWDIEVFFKTIKRNFNISVAYSRTEQEMSICNECSLIMSYIIKAIKNSILSELEDKSTKDKKININETRIFNNFKEVILNKLLLNTNVQFEDLINFIDKFCPPIKQQNDRHYERISKTPGTKWHAKKNSNMSAEKLILEMIDNNTINKLDKNKKLLANKITIVNKTIIK